MAPRFFVDENDLALAKALAYRHDIGTVLFPGHVDLPDIPRQTPDDAWLGVVGVQRLVVITRDQRIRYRPVERRMWVQHLGRGFVLTGRTSQSTADSLELVASHWARIEHLVVSRPEGPWMYAVTKAGLRLISLD